MTVLLPMILLLPIMMGVWLLLMKPRAEAARMIGVGTSILVALMSLAVLCSFDPTQVAVAQGMISIPWIPDWGVHLAVGVDGYNIALMVLSALLMPVVMIAIWPKLDDRLATQMGLLLLLEGGALGTFLSQDLLLFYVFWELVLIPAYFLLGMFGGVKRIDATMQFFIYTFAGSIFMLLAIAGIMVYQSHPGQVPDLSFLGLKQAMSLPFHGASLGEALRSWQGFIFMGFSLAFLVKTPLWPLHGWLKQTYMEAPAPVALYIAAILSKMGIYGMVKILWPLCPDAAAFFSPVLMICAAIGILYGAFVATKQTHIRGLIAYTSLSHMNGMVLGVASMTLFGLQGSMFQMTSHILTTAGLFLCAYFIEQRMGSGLLAHTQGIGKKAPVFAFMLLVFVLASLGLPLTSGFPGEYLIFAGAFSKAPVLTAISVLVTVCISVYLLKAYQGLVYGTFSGKTFCDLSPREFFLGFGLCVVILLLGFMPFMVMRLSEPTLGEFMKELGQRVYTASSHRVW